MLKRLTPHIVILATAAIVVACGGSEQALLVSPQLESAIPLGVVADTTGAAVHPIKRRLGRGQNESWSFDVDAKGGTFRYPSVGLTIRVPRGAVTARTHITVTALEGDAIAYRFEPHGLQFNAPLELTQSLHDVALPTGNATTSQLFGGYFATDSLKVDASTGLTRVVEILPLEIDVRGNAVVLSIHHFSGYLVASNLSDPLQCFGNAANDCHSAE